MSEPEAPLERKNSNFGKILLWGSHVRTLGALLIMLIIWVLEKLWLLNKAMIESGFSGVLNWVNLEILRAVSTEKPQVLTR